jgi:hypothetical protein
MYSTSVKIIHKKTIKSTDLNIYNYIPKEAQRGQGWPKSRAVKKC